MLVLYTRGKEIEIETFIGCKLEKYYVYNIFTTNSK